MNRKIREIRIDGQVAYVPLTKGYEAIIDAQDVPLVAGWNWTADVKPHTVYAYRRDHSAIKPQYLGMHRVLMGKPDGKEIDHRDGDGLNNRRHGETGNLREATRGQNAKNVRINSSNSSGFKGVSFFKRTGAWRARINANGSEVSLGYYATPEEAHARVCVARAEMHGAFGRVA